MSFEETLAECWAAVRRIEGSSPASTAVVKPSPAPVATRKPRRMPLRVSAERLEAMYRDYQAPMSFRAVGRKYGRTSTAVRDLFIVRGLAVREDPRPKHEYNSADGRFVKVVHITEADVDRIVAAATRIAIPPELRWAWRAWSLERRAEFIRRVRTKLKRRDDRPEFPFSSNVEPFDYGSPHAWEIVNRMNRGETSRRAPMKLCLCSQGVIWRGELWFWSRKVGYQCGPWRPERGRPVLHTTIWEVTHGRRVPAGHVVRFSDRNPNNLSPGNLVLATRNDVARENQAAWLARKARETTELLLNLSQQSTKGTSHELATGIRAARG